MSENGIDDASESTMKRRRVLASMGTIGAAIGSSGAASAGLTGGFSDDEAKAAIEGYESVDAVEEAIESDSEILKAASELGALDDTSAEALEIESLGEPDSERDPAVEVVARSGADGPTPKVMVQKEVEAGLLTLGTKPEEEEQFAVLETPDGERQQLSLCDCDDDCECDTRCTPMKNSLTCNGSWRYEPRTYCDCPGW